MNIELSRSRPYKIFVILAVSLVLLQGTSFTSEFESHWDRSPDRIWIGPQYWTNPMEDWRLTDGAIESVSTGGDRNVHLLTRELTDRDAAFSLSVRLALVERGETGSAGFRVGIHDEINDYRGNLLWGRGIDAGVTVNGRLMIDGKVMPNDPVPLKDVILELVAEPSDAFYDLILSAKDPDTGNVLARMVGDAASERLVGNLALVNNFDGKKKKGSRFRFRDWKCSGPKIAAREKRAFGPILWAMHTLSDSRGEEGHVLKMTAQMPPLGEMDLATVRFERKLNDKWTPLGTSVIHPDARTATFRFPRWPADRDVPYRLVYLLRDRDGKETPHHWEGTVRKDPVGKNPLVFAGMTCQYHYAFPYTPLVENLTAKDPDLLYFSGDQIYEANGHYGIIRTPADRSILNYLRKWYLFGWAFGDLMRDRPTLCTPDDHDVFQGNLWGDGGHATTMRDHNAGGYAQPVAMVQVVHRTNTAHHPDFFNPRPIDQGIDVYYGDMVYGRVSFAVVSDRMFKSGPRDTVSEWEGRPDHLKNPGYDVSKLDKPGLTLLGDRQLTFLNRWVEDWRGADMKLFLSQTLFANAATHHGRHDAYLEADLDSCGWPQSGRNRAIAVIRKGFALHVCGDQHLTTLIHHGIETQRDGFWSFCTPAIAVGYQRWWRPDEMGRPHTHRPAHGLPDTGEYIDGFGNRIFVQAVGNPEGSRDPNRYAQAQLRASGFALVRIDRKARTYACEAYRFLADPEEDGPDAQFPGFPFVIEQRENYGRKPAGFLPDVSFEGLKNPVVKVYDEATDELIYALRVQGERFTPWVYHAGSYRVRIGDPDQEMWKVFIGLRMR